MAVATLNPLEEVRTVDKNQKSSQVVGATSEDIKIVIHFSEGIMKDHQMLLLELNQKIKSLMADC